jgi:hypothetical protein
MSTPRSLREATIARLAATQPAWTPQPPSSRPSTVHSGARGVESDAGAGDVLVTVVHMRNGAFACPLCGIADPDPISFKTHVFECRLQHGVDPLLPLTVIRPIHGARPPQHRPSLPPVPPVSTGRAGRPHGKSVGSLPAGTPSKSPRGAVSSGSNTPRGSGSTSRRRNTWNVADNFGASRADDLDMILRPIAPGVERIELFKGRPAANAPPTVEARRRSLPPITFSDSKLSQDIQYFLSLESHEDLVLTLTGVQISTRDATLLHSLLGDWQLVVSALDLSDAIAVTSEAEHLVIRGIMRNRFVTTVKDTNCGFAKRLQAPAVRDHLTVNMRRREESARSAQFEKWVSDFTAAEQAARAAYAAMTDDERDERKAIAGEESAARTALCVAFEQQIASLLVRIARRDNRRSFRDQCEGVEEEEAESRIAGVRLHSTGLAEILSRFEASSRALIIADRESTRTDLKLTERREVFVAKDRERARYAAERRAREDLCAVEDTQREELEERQFAARAVLDTQKRRRREYLKWREDQRGQIADLIKYEEDSRQGFLKEEANLFVSSREKFSVTIKTLLARYAAQREEVEHLGAVARRHYEGNYEALIAHEMQVFKLTLRLLKLRVKAHEREAARRALLDAPPQIHVDLGAYQRPIYVLPAVGQPHRPHMPVARDAKVSVAMPADWAAKLQEVELRCKQALTEERAVMTELLTLLYKNASAAQRVREFVLGYEQIAAAPGTDYHHQQQQQQQQHSSSRTFRGTALAKASVESMEMSYLADEPWFRHAPFPVGFALASSPTKSGSRPPSTQGLDSAFIKARDEALKYRSAWHDVASAAAIAGAKEAVVGGSAEFWCDGDAHAMRW